MPPIIRYAALFAGICISAYGLYYILPVIGVLNDIPDLVKINPAIEQYVKQFGLMRTLIRTLLIDVPLVLFFAVFFFYSNPKRRKGKKR